MFPLNSDIVTSLKGSNCYRIHMPPSRGNKFVSLRGGPLPVSLIHYFLQGPRPLNVPASRPLFICLLLILPWKCSKICLRVPIKLKKKILESINCDSISIFRKFIYSIKKKSWFIFTSRVNHQLSLLINYWDKLDIYN